jgi:hypothetical protein
MQHSELEFNLCHIFHQLVKIGVDPSEVSVRSKRNSMISGDSSAFGANAGPSLTIEQLRHVFNFLQPYAPQPNVPLNDHELKEILSMLDDNGDGNVTMTDFMHALKVTGTSHFDSRFAVNFPWTALDGVSKDGSLTEEDFRAARDGLGSVWSCANDSEYHAIIRSMQQLGNQHERMGAGNAPAATASVEASPEHSPSLGPRKLARGVDKESFRRIVSALAISAPDAPPSVSNNSTGAGRSPIVSHAPSPIIPLTHAQMHPSAYLDESPSTVNITDIGGMLPHAALTYMSGSSLPNSMFAPSSLPTLAEYESATETAALQPLSLTGIHTQPHPPNTARPSVSRKPSIATGTSGAQSTRAGTSRRPSQLTNNSSKLKP